MPEQSLSPDSNDSQSDTVYVNGSATLYAQVTPPDTLSEVKPKLFDKSLVIALIFLAGALLIDAALYASAVYGDSLGSGFLLILVVVMVTIPTFIAVVGIFIGNIVRGIKTRN